MTLPMRYSLVRWLCLEMLFTKHSSNRGLEFGNIWKANISVMGKKQRPHVRPLLDLDQKRNFIAYLKVYHMGSTTRFQKLSISYPPLLGISSCASHRWMYL